MMWVGEQVSGGCDVIVPLKKVPPDVRTPIPNFFHCNLGLLSPNGDFPPQACAYRAPDAKNTPDTPNLGLR